MMKKNSQTYGWRPQKPDFRDHVFKLASPVVLPPSVDLSATCPSVYDQGQLGSCTANAIAAAMEFDQLKQNNKLDFMPSRLFIYYNERAMEGTIKSDAGAEIRDGIKSVNNLGVCKESTLPYNIAKFKTKPKAVCFKEGLLHKSVSYKSLTNTNLNDLLSCLASGVPFVFGFTVYESFESATVAQTGIVPMPSKTESVLGGHAVMAVGYDQSKKMFLVRNSWGSSWGLNGYFWMPFDYMTSANLASDFWVIQTITSA